MRRSHHEGTTRLGLNMYPHLHLQDAFVAMRVRDWCSLQALHNSGGEPASLNRDWVATSLAV